MLLELISRVHAQTFVAPDLSPVAATNTNIRTFITNIGAFIMWIAGALALGYLIYGGILYITAGGDAEKATKGRTAIINAVIGIVVVLMALIIINWVRGVAETNGTIGS